MNPLLVVVLVVGAVAVLPTQTTQDVLATAAATLFEGTPFILAAAALAHWLPRRHHWLIPLLGCGCNEGPGARSLPSAAATWLAFGPTVALARLGAATAIGFLLSFRAGAAAPSSPSNPNYLSLLYGLLPFGLAAGVISHVLPWLLIPGNGRRGHGPARSSASRWLRAAWGPSGWRVPCARLLPAC